MSNNCIVCGAAAFIYRIENDGGRSYLCDKHVQASDMAQARIMADEGKGADKSGAEAD
jgi:hypothetical protein